MSILKLVNYAPSTGTNLNATSTTNAAVDSTNLTFTFNAPASGNVVVMMSGLIVLADSSVNAYVTKLLLTTHGGTTQVPNSSVHGFQSVNNDGSNRSLLSNTFLFYVTGLTGGNSYSWDLSYVAQNVASNATINYGASVVANANEYGPVSMVVFEA